MGDRAQNPSQAPLGTKNDFKADLPHIFTEQRVGQ